MKMNVRIAVAVMMTFLSRLGCQPEKKTSDVENYGDFRPLQQSFVAETNLKSFSKGKHKSYSSSSSKKKKGKGPKKGSYGDDGDDYEQDGDDDDNDDEGDGDDDNDDDEKKKKNKGGVKSDHGKGSKGEAYSTGYQDDESSNSSGSSNDALEDYVEDESPEATSPTLDPASTPSPTATFYPTNHPSYPTYIPSTSSPTSTLYPTSANPTPDPTWAKYYHTEYPTTLPSISVHPTNSQKPTPQPSFEPTYSKYKFWFWMGEKKVKRSFPPTVAPSACNASYAKSHLECNQTLTAAKKGEREEEEEEEGEKDDDDIEDAVRDVEGVGKEIEDMIEGKTESAEPSLMPVPEPSLQPVPQPTLQPTVGTPTAVTTAEPSAAVIAQLPVSEATKSDVPVTSPTPVPSNAQSMDEDAAVSSTYYSYPSSGEPPSANAEDIHPAEGSETNGSSDSGENLEGSGQQTAEPADTSSAIPENAEGLGSNIQEQNPQTLSATAPVASTREEVSVKGGVVGEGGSILLSTEHFWRYILFAVAVSAIIVLFMVHSCSPNQAKYTEIEEDEESLLEHPKHHPKHHLYIAGQSSGKSNGIGLGNTATQHLPDRRARDSLRVSRI